MAVTLNQDTEMVAAIRQGLKRTGGYCPCRLQRTEENKCICQEFRQQIADPSFEATATVCFITRAKTNIILPRRIKSCLLPHVTKENFEQEVLNSDKPVLVDFWAAWCGPCRMLSPVVDQVAEETPSVKVCKINIDEQQDLAAQYNVMSIPTLMVFKAGNVVNTSVGVVPKAKILEML